MDTESGVVSSQELSSWSQPRHLRAVMLCVMLSEDVPLKNAIDITPAVSSETLVIPVVMEKPWRLWGALEACLLTMCAWSWGVCRVSLLALILTFHLYGGLILLGLILASVAGILYKFQDVLLYFPDQPSSSRLYVPMPTGIPHENVYIRTKDGVRLNLILLRYTGENPAAAPTILYFHGNAGNIGHRVPNALLMLVNLKANVVLVDYRGYGKSEGEPSEEGLYQDAEATLDYIMTRPDIDKTKVVLFGRSLGGAVAIRLASCNPHRVAAIMVENTFLSIPHMAATLFSFFPMRYLPLWCYKNKFLSYRHVALCRMPSLFISGLSDQLIPPVMMKQLYELSPSRTKRLGIFPEDKLLSEFVSTMPAEDVGPGRGERRRLPWLFLVLVIAAITSSSLSVISLYHVLALQAEVEGLRAEVVRKREEQSGTLEETMSGTEKQTHEQEEKENKERIEYLQQNEMDDTVTDHTVLSKRSLESQPCLQMMADNKKTTFQKEFALELCTAIPWQVGLKRGSALEEEQGTILVKEEGFFFIYSQVYYTDSTFAMGHIVIRIKKNVVGDESQHVVLFRCIQSMNRVNHFNTCYTGGELKLDSGDRLELLIPRTHANISLDGDSTFLGAIKLA
ncbi:hypothetical protein Q8A67_007062 [Cirrhinus molitorella]|uniref:THD domain-containing protein n=1 Tax=Cirrhinus molitorella TaxID=172907 RepID=A0AA88U1U9_9TELE|nr:hypothetical protein Q8A67_007062 [Cirrhinus molitorella]